MCEDVEGLVGRHGSDLFGVAYALLGRVGKSGLALVGWRMPKGDILT